MTAKKKKETLAEYQHPQGFLLLLRNQNSITFRLIWISFRFVMMCGIISCHHGERNQSGCQHNAHELSPAFR